MKDDQTPQKEQARSMEISNRRSKSKPDQANRHPKVSRKSLSPAFKSVSEDESLESFNESVHDFSPNSEVTDGDQRRESAESFTATLDPSFPDSPEMLIALSDKEKFSYLEIRSLESEMLVKLLRQAQIQVSKSADTDLRFKRILDALIKCVIEELAVLPEEKNLSTNDILAKLMTLLMSITLWSLVTIWMIYFYYSGISRSSFHPPPT